MQFQRKKVKVLTLPYFSSSVWSWDTRPLATPRAPSAPWSSSRWSAAATRSRSPWSRSWRPPARPLDQPSGLPAIPRKAWLSSFRWSRCPTRRTRPKGRLPWSRRRRRSTLRWSLRWPERRNPRTRWRSIWTWRGQAVTGSSFEPWARSCTWASLLAERRDSANREAGLRPFVARRLPPEGREVRLVVWMGCWKARWPLRQRRTEKMRRFFGRRKTRSPHIDFRNLLIEASSNFRALSVLPVPL